MSAETMLLTQPFTVPFDAINYSLLVVNCFSQTSSFQVPS